MKIYLITDTHLYHDKMVEYCGRPENHTELIIRNWASLLEWDDLTIHLGDVIFREKNKLKGILAAVAGRKVLVKGNHDRESNHWYLTNGFDFVCNSFTLGDILYTHIPAQSLPEGIRLNIHGHYHNNDHRLFDVQPKEFNKLLAIENTEYKPVLLEEFIKTL